MFGPIARVLAVIIFLVSALHIVLGPAAENLLGAGLDATALANPVLASQNRFYGAAFALFGAVFWVGSWDVRRYAPLLRAAVVIFFLAGLARLVAVAFTGLPSIPVLSLFASELILPPILWILLARAAGDIR